uniref:Uncharacterized protein n=1 Tax=Tanacetum cinerariifolium TaxID=118510 RepID=A0A699JB95_TANCI|nr:hypothetical protein [Tanacetum cinerariifolium]
MGCFLSTKTNKQPPTPQPKHNDPTPSEEENKTKQETPQILFKNNTSHDATVKKPTEEHVSEQVSDMCSYTDSFFSVATTTTTVTTDGKVNVAKTEDDDDGEVTQKLNTCPPTKRIPKKPPNKLSDKRELLPSNIMQTRQHNRNVVRRDKPARKPRSSGGLGKCRNVTLKHSEEMNVKLGGNKGKVKVVKIGDGGVSVPPVLVPEPDPEISESLENPLITLECFIFL